MSKSKKIHDLENEFTDEKEQVESVQNQTLGVSGRPTTKQKRMQLMYDQEEPLFPAESGFLDGYMRLIKETNKNTQAIYDNIIPMDVNVMSHKSLSDNAIKDNNDRLHMISNQFGLAGRSLKTEKKAKKHKRLDNQVNW